ncbi:hydroxypyruvate isomerase family protein [Olivibacter sitiensis]|uniref:hydroxypyruvate isomerase family protein n=1 Tax=Olivibacter sitiensis TaxID=376470 RepID=UPI00040A481C|nr:TIM barrel protein [Olivibacter sitiensis]
MNRSTFIKQGFLAAGAAVTANSLYGYNSSSSKMADTTFKLNYAPHDGMFKELAGASFLDQIRYMHDRGFRAIEDNGMSGRPIAEQKAIGDLLSKLGMQMGVFVLDKGGNGANTLATNNKDHLEIFIKGCKQAVEISKRCGGKFTTVVPGDFHRALPIEQQTANVIDALRRGAEILEPHGIVMVLEPLSDTPDLFLRTSQQTYLICRAVNSPSCKILYDVYHMQRNEGDLIKNMELTWNEIAYIQTGDNPGRKEPTTGEINYKNLFKFLHEKGYKDPVGMEHGISKPGKEGEERLVQAYREVDDF